MIDPDSLIKRKGPPPEQVACRFSGTDLLALNVLRDLTPALTDSQRLQDAVRLAAYVMAKRSLGDHCLPGVVEFLGVF